MELWCGLRSAALCTAAVLACSSGIALADSAPDPDTPAPVRALAAARPAPNGARLLTAAQGSGRVLDLTVYSEAMGRTLPVEVLPAVDDSQPAPILYLLNGVDGRTDTGIWSDGNNWLTKTDAERFFADKQVTVVVFSATIVVAAAGGILLFPHGFLRSFAYGAIVTIALAALTAVTLLPALLAVLGRRVDLLGFDWFRKTGSADDVPDNFWGRVAAVVMKRPLVVAIPVCAGLLLLIAPVQHLAFGGITERFLPPDHPTRLAQQHFDETFPLRRIDPIYLVMTTYHSPDIETVVMRAEQAPGLAAPFPKPTQRPAQPFVYTTETVLASSTDADATIDYLRSMDLPKGTTMMVGGEPAAQRDSIDALLDRLPLMLAVVFIATSALLLLTFGSIVLPLEAAVLNLLGLGASIGVLTWIFVEGHGTGLLGFTPQPIMPLVLMLIVSVIYGLSTDYEVFLLARIVEARKAGASTTEAVRTGVARIGRIISAAALILIVVTGVFALSDLVMMQYIALGMVTALFIDATVLRMLLVPATMKLLGDACWWAPAWPRRIQRNAVVREPVTDSAAAMPTASRSESDPTSV
ncbi:MMPL family transporter [Nocardia sp. NPDC049737]|uniref:MMPL family transporter n=1 Tax=Nocardia sp. NPDC049737 TaxID=3154358 RepID=UPI00343BDAD7